MTENPMIRTRWLDSDERRAWLALAAVTTLLPSALDAQLQRDSGLTYFEYLVMAMLSEAADRTAPMSVLAAYSSASLSRLSHVASKLQRRGWLSRRPDPDNGRVTLATLTDTGMAQLTGTAPGHVNEVRRLVFDTLTTAQIRQLRTIGERLFAVLDPHGRLTPLGDPRCPDGRLDGTRAG